LIVGLDLASLSSLFSLFAVHVTFVGDFKKERTGRKKLKMAEEMAAPTSGAPAAATDHGFTSHQEGPAPVPFNNASRRSTLSKSYLDVNVAGTTTPLSVNRHSHAGDIALENYFVCPFNFSAGSFAESSADEKDRSGPEIWTPTRNYRISCECMAVLCRG
jgi:hypothetical protein